MLSHRSAFRHGVTIDRIKHAYDHVIFTTATGRELTDTDVDAIADDVATRDYDVGEIRRRVDRLSEPVRHNSFLSGWTPSC